MQNFIGQTLGRYHILEQLGEGGMAIVYKAFDMRLERHVAIKIIRNDLFGSAQMEHMLLRFEREAKALAKLSHPNIVKVLDFGEHNGIPYLVMEYMPGGTLKKRVTEKPIPWHNAIQLLIPIATALDYAHKQKIIHRDVKPANILLTANGQPMLSDFGIAKILEIENGHALTGTGVGVGTPEYMAPEQSMGEVVDARSDIYSLGIVFFELVTGRKPYIADTPMAVILKHIKDPIPRPRQYVNNLPNAVEYVLIKAMAKDPKDRYPDAEAFVAAMKNLADNVTFGSLHTKAAANTSGIAETLTANVGEFPAHTSSSKGSVNRTWGRSFSLVSAILGLGAFGIVIICLIITFLWAGNFFPSTATSTVTPEDLAVTEFPASTETIAASEETFSATSTFPAPATPIETKIPENNPVVPGEDGMALVYVPAGEFKMGSTNTDDDEKPVHTVYLDAFWIDQTEVTIALFSTFVEATGYQTDAEKKGTASVFDGSNWIQINGADWQHPTGPGSAISGRDKHPITLVSWNDAVAYCKWVGRRLPTEAEWEKAALGTDGRIYPWGNNNPTARLLNFNFNINDTTPAGSFPNGISPYGAYDMAGNVWEWVADWYSETYYQRSPAANPLGPDSGEFHVLRGGSWNDGLSGNVLSSNRRRDNPSDSNNLLGFRCAKTD